LTNAANEGHEIAIEALKILDKIEATTATAAAIS